VATVAAGRQWTCTETRGGTVPPEAALLLRRDVRVPCPVAGHKNSENKKNSKLPYVAEGICMGHRAASASRECEAKNIQEREPESDPGPPSETDNPERPDPALFPFANETDHGV
jgi:hypothetical protein